MIRLLDRYKWLILIGILLIHASLLGPSDDEAYYWSVGQTFHLGSAYHPPAVAWLIYGFQNALSWLLGHSPLLLRLPALFCAGIGVACSLLWIRDLRSLSRPPANASFFDPMALLVSFPGIFAFSWMTVPDLPLFAGWNLLFLATWRLIHTTLTRRHVAGWLCVAFIGSTLCVLSKFSGILCIASALSAIILLGLPRAKPHSKTQLGLTALFICTGLVLGALPTYLWNSTHAWESLLFQVQGRHQSRSFSGMRWLQFIGSQLLLTGPMLVIGCHLLIKRSYQSVHSYRYLLLWTLPPAILFGIQPLFSNFKMNWALIAWWPLFLGAALVDPPTPLFSRMKKIQIGYGLVFSSLLLIACHVPWMTWVGKFYSGEKFQPTWDVTNDFYGWSDLAQHLSKVATNTDCKESLVLGSRYQTAGQAAFALGPSRTATLWPLRISEEDDWPKIRWCSSYFVVASQRFPNGPSDPNCTPLPTLETYRWGQLAQRIFIWQCHLKQ